MDIIVRASANNYFKKMLIKKWKLTLVRAVPSVMISFKYPGQEQVLISSKKT